MKYWNTFKDTQSHLYIMKIILLFFILINNSYGIEKCSSFLEKSIAVSQLHIGSPNVAQLFAFRFKDTFVDTIDPFKTYLTVEDVKEIKSKFTVNKIPKIVNGIIQNNDCTVFEESIAVQKRGYERWIKTIEKLLKKKKLIEHKKFIRKRVSNKDYEKMVEGTLFSMQIVEKNGIIDQLRISQKKENSIRIQEYLVKSMMRAMDPHSSYMLVEEQDSFFKRVEGIYIGLGIEYKVEKKGLTIIGLHDESVFNKEEVKKGDLLVEVNGINIKNNNYKMPMSLIKGKIDDMAKITISRKGKLYKLQAKLKSFFLESVKPKGELKGRNLYITVPTFYSSTDASMTLDFYKEYKKFKKKDFDSIVLDFRNNGGGVFGEAIYLSSLFLNEGDILVQSISRDNGVSIEKRRQKNGLPISQQALIKEPLIILMNKNTASASEIVISALMDNGRALVVGDRSYGKGTMQGINDLNSVLKENDDNIFIITSGMFFPPSGRSFQGKGIKPNIVIKDEGLYQTEDKFDYFMEIDDAPAVKAYPKKLSKIYDKIATKLRNSNIKNLNVDEIFKKLK
jgi:carboxyl-terminal processing protease